MPACFRLPTRPPLLSQRGQTLTEFALVLPLLVFLLLGVLQLGLTFNNHVSLTDAARAGARKGAVARHTSTNPAKAAEDEVRRAAGGLRKADLSVTVSSSWKLGEPVTITASYPYSISLLGLVVKSGRLSTRAEERVE